MLRLNYRGEGDDSLTYALGALIALRELSAAHFLPESLCLPRSTSSRSIHDRVTHVAVRRGLAMSDGKYFGGAKKGLRTQLILLRTTSAYCIAPPSSRIILSSSLHWAWTRLHGGHSTIVVK